MLGPLFNVYANLEAHRRSRPPIARPGVATQTVAIETPNSLLPLLTTSAPFAIIQILFAMLVIYFFLAGWTRVRLPLQSPAARPSPAR